MVLLVVINLNIKANKFMKLAIEMTYIFFFAIVAILWDFIKAFWWLLILFIIFGLWRA